MTENMANGYSSESTRRELFNENQHDKLLMVYKNVLHFSLMDEGSLSMEMVNPSNAEGCKDF